MHRKAVSLCEHNLKEFKGKVMFTRTLVNRKNCMHLTLAKSYSLQYHNNKKNNKIGSVVMGRNSKIESK